MIVSTVFNRLSAIVRASVYFISLEDAFDVNVLLQWQSVRIIILMLVAGKQTLCGM